MSSLLPADAPSAVLCLLRLTGLRLPADSLPCGCVPSFLRCTWRTAETCVIDGRARQNGKTGAKGGGKHRKKRKLDSCNKSQRQLEPLLLSLASIFGDVTECNYLNYVRNVPLPSGRTFFVLRFYYLSIHPK